MLLIGNDCINDDEARTQMAIWCIIAAPLIMGNDLRNVSETARMILQNRDAIKVNQDPMGRQVPFIIFYIILELYLWSMR